MNSAIILFSTLAIMILINIPISVALGLSSCITLVFAGFPLSSIPAILQSTVEKFTLLSIPLFVLAGNAMGYGGISKRLIDFAKCLVGSVTGGLGYVMIIVSCFFAAISGSGPATVAATGSILIPAMEKEGYDPAFTSALSAASGSLGIVIPPSIAFIIYGMVSGVSIGDLFISGFVPGLIIAACFAVIVFFKSHKHGWGKETGTHSSAKETLKAFKDAMWGIMSPVIVLGGIYGGIFTPTEAAAVAAVYSFFVGIFIYKEMKWPEIKKALISSCHTTGVIMLIVASAGIFSFLLARQGIATSLTNLALSITDNKYVLLLIINIVFLIAGCLMDNASAMYILLPIILPIASAVGIDPLHLGVIVVTNLALGQVTPPVGPALYVAADIGHIKLKNIALSALPLIMAHFIALLILTYIPQLCTFLVR